MYFWGMETAYTKYLKVGPVVYEMTAEVEMKVMDDCANFISDEMPAFHEATDLLVHCHIHLTDKTSVQIDGQVVYQDEKRVVLNHDGLERRLHLEQGAMYGYYREEDETHITVEIPRYGEGPLMISTFFLELLAFDRFLFRQNALVLHSAFIEWQGQGIDFTAPSGTGKSTQASLWEKYEGTEVVNGDRSIIWLNPLTQRFEVCGLPFCGSSNIHLNKRMPLRAIVFIEQHPTNVVEVMPQSRAAGKLFGEMSINQWNREVVLKSLDFIEKLSSEVTMVHLKCNMEQDAVNTLKHFLETH